MKSRSDYPPHLLNFRRDGIGSGGFSDCICLWSHWTQGMEMLFPWQGSVCPEITTSRIIPLEYPLDPFSLVLEPSLEGFMRYSTRTPKYSCRDCWTGVYPMENQQQEPEVRPLWGLKRIPLTDKPKGERILETVNRMITRIQTAKEKCLWSNTPTRPAWECRYPSKRIWLPSVTSITSTSLTWWDVQSYGSWRTFNRIQTRPHGICFYKVILGYPSDMTF